MMKVINLIRSLHKDSVIIVDDYDSYYVYGMDAYIVYYLLGLNIKKCNGVCFIKNSIDYLNYLTCELKKNKVSYIVVLKRFGYNVEEALEFEDNNYYKYYKRGKLVYKRMKDIIMIKNKLRCKILDNEDKINKVKELMYLECMINI